MIDPIGVKPGTVQGGRFDSGQATKVTALDAVRAPQPAVVAETDDYVAIASEFRSLAHLPDVKHARVFEPAPEEMYVWQA